MSRTRSRRSRLSFEPLEDRLAPATFVVTTNADSGAGSLREAILNANALAGADRIEFAIGTGHQTIDLLSALPVITNPVTIAGQTQPGFVDRPLIELNGAGAGADADGIFVRAGGVGSVIRGLVINRFDDDGIHLTRTSVIVQGCFIGTDATGTIALGNGTGITVSGSHFVTGAACTIGGTTAGAGNLISGNLGDGILLDTGTTVGVVVQGNLIGTDATGTLDLGNSGQGVHLFWGARDNVIGGTAAAAGNIISGNGGHGVLMEGILIPHGGGGSTTENRVQGNRIGTDANGTNAIANGGHGVAILEFCGSNVIGGGLPGAGNLISGNAGDGVHVAGSGNDSNRVRGNLIGTDISGSIALANTDDGVSVEDGAANNFIGGTGPLALNVISGNGNDGVVIGGDGTSGNQVLGNYIGTDKTGTVELGNFSIGVVIEGGAANNLLGGVTPAERNVISGNGGAGVWVEGAGTTGNRVQGNYIGTDKTGTIALANDEGVAVFGGASGNTIGGAAAGARNVISGNAGRGVQIDGAATTANRVRGNYIGTDKTGAQDLGNAQYGVGLTGGAHENLIGGTTAGTRNVISGNDGVGVQFQDAATTGNLVQGNRIGLAATTAAPLGNTLDGVLIVDASDNRVGGTAAGAGNVIANNGGNGVWVASGTGIRILGNRIFDNGDLGIDLGPPGITPNDINDPDPGANLLQNFPILDSAVLKPLGLRVQGSINTEANRSIWIELFASPEPDPSGNGEGRRSLGFVRLTTNASGDAAFNVLLSSAGILAGHVITATATDLGFGNTSEFSAARMVEPVP